MIAALLLGASALWAVVSVARYWAFEVDDAFISLRYASNLVAGHGITWNPGEHPPVEGYSNFTFVILGGLAMAARVDPILVLKFFGVAALFATAVLLYAFSRQWLGPIGSTIPPMIYLAYEGPALWSVSGLETSVYVALAIAAFLLFSRALRGDSEGGGVTDGVPSDRALLGAGVLCVLAAMTRPEGPLVAIAIVIGLGVHAIRRGISGRRIRALLVFCLAFGIPYLAYFLWRVSYFERLLPNTVYCKAGHDAEMTLVRDAAWLSAPYLLMAMFTALRRPDGRHAALAVFPLLYAVVLAGADPIIGHFNRHFLAAWAALLLLAAPGLVAAIEHVRRVRPPWREPVAVVLVILLLLGAGAGPKDFDVDRWTDRYEKRMDARRELGAWLATRLGPDDAYLLGDCGVIPFHAGGIAIDAFCLNSREMTAPPISGSVPRFIDHVLEERAPEYVIVHSTKSRALEPRPEYGFFPMLVEHPLFGSDYVPVRVFGAEGDDFHYWVYRRGSSGPPALP